MKTTLIHSQHGDYWIGRFEAMAGPCELLLELSGQETAQALLDDVAAETWRIEAKFSRYRDDNIIHRINHAGGATVVLDEECANLLDYAAQCYRLSGGLFDITAGVLRRIWRFVPGATPPDEAAITALLPLIGWQRVRWERPHLTLPAGMELDLGGIGKEYAVDRAAQRLAGRTDASFVVNFGGDLYINRPRQNGEPWHIAIDNPQASGRDSVATLRISHGGLTTSGDARRHLLHRGVRYGHILNPLTGRPVEGAPRSVTVLAGSCMEAGMLSTFAMLHGGGAEAFLQAQQVRYWLVKG